MTVYKSDQSSRPGHASSESGNTWSDNSKATVNANLTTSDEVVLLVVPAGVRLDELAYRAGDLDTGTTLTMNIGYRSLHPDKQVADNFTAFLSAGTGFQAAQASWVEAVFDPIVFNEPVAIVARPQASATGLSGTPSIYTRARGQVVGVI
jgi:hypothetical protein